MQHFLILIFFLFIYNTTFSQEKKADSILTESQNANWITKFEKINSKSSQITAIKEKVLSDTIYNKKKIPCEVYVKEGETASEAIKKSDCQCKILFFLSVREDSYILDPILFTKTNQILELITSKNIDKMTIIRKENIASALYGSRGRCGVIIMTSNNRKFKRKLRKSLKNNSSN
ncbi:hypothetical protein [uncultured Winogradskyella sp.]|uniref:hypothetical protein n=1 Tax=uncultured Winogradskyella sp. TaxID=395353 RepID=UPI00261CA239|nr:hypothetical protein [uncultured Winogradskyella sp.]